MIPMSSTKVKAPPKNSMVLFFSYTIHIWIVCVVCIVCCERDIYIHHVYTYELGGNPS